MGTWLDCAYRGAAFVVIAAAWLAFHPAAHAAEALLIAAARLPLNLPVFVAQDQGYFAQEKLVIRLVDCVTGRECLARMLRGQASLAASAELPLAVSALAGASFSIFATIATSDNYNKVVVRRDAAIVSVKDLVGRRVGTFLGTSAQYFLETSLMLAGIDPASVQVVGVTPGDAERALRVGEVDALAIFEPHALRARRSLGDSVFILEGRGTVTDSWNVAASHVGVTQLAALCRALDRAVRFIAEHPVRAKAILSKEIAMNAADIDAIWSDLRFELALRQSLVTNLEAQARWALRGGHASGTAPNFLDHIVTMPLRGLHPAAVSIVE